MKTKIKEVQKYFTDKIIKGEYKLVSLQNYTAFILIDDEFTFALWITKEEFLKLYLATSENFMNLPEFTPEERAEAFKNVSAKIEAYKKAVLNSEKLKQFEELKVYLEEEKIISKS